MNYYNADCMNPINGLPSYKDKYFDLAIVDPPYRDAKENAPTKDIYTGTNENRNNRIILVWLIINRPVVYYHKEAR